MQETTPSSSACSAAASVASIFAAPTARSSVKEKFPICLSASLRSLASSSADALDRCWRSCSSVLRPRSPRRYVAAAVSVERTLSNAWQSAVVLAEAGRATSRTANIVKGTASIVSVFIVPPGIEVHSPRLRCVVHLRRRLRRRFRPGRQRTALQFEVPFPELVDGRVDDQLEEERGEDAAHHRRGDPLHHVRSGAGGPEDGHEPDEGGGHGHELRPQALH